MCHPCYHLSSLLLLVGNRDDSNRDDKKYANSHLLCFLKAKTYTCFHNNIEAYDTYSVFGRFFEYQHFVFLKRLVTGMTYNLSFSLPTLFFFFFFIFIPEHFFFLFY